MEGLTTSIVTSAMTLLAVIGFILYNFRSMKNNLLEIKKDIQASINTIKNDMENDNKEIKATIKDIREHWQSTDKEVVKNTVNIEGLTNRIDRSKINGHK